MTTLHDTADAVRSQIAAGSYTLSFTPTLQYDTDLVLEDIDTLDVAIVAASLTQQADSRNSLRYEVGVDVAVRYRFGTAEHDGEGKIKTAQIEAYIGLLEEIAEELADPSNRTLTDKAAAAWIRNEFRYPWVPEHLRQNRQYTGIFRATYVVMMDAS